MTAIRAAGVDCEPVLGSTRTRVVAVEAADLDGVQVFTELRAVDATSPDRFRYGSGVTARTPGAAAEQVAAEVAVREEHAAPGPLPCSNHP